MPKKRTTRRYYPKALRAEIEAMRLVWRERSPQTRFTLRQLHALVRLEHRWREPKDDEGLWPGFEKHQAELKTIFDSTHERFWRLRVAVRHLMMNNTAPFGPGTHEE